jgi:phage-related protein (TIGR01555 family)
MDLNKKLAAFEARANKSQRCSGPAVVLQNRQDVYQNTFSGFGGPRDPLQRTWFAAETVMYQTELEQLYRFYWLARRIVDLLPADACREGIDLNIEDANTGAAVNRRMDELFVWERIEEALRMARLYGGSVMVLGALDGQEPTTPLAIERVTKMVSLTILDRWQLSVSKVFDDPLAPEFGRPELYRINPVNAGTNQQASMVHASRVIRFDGAWLPDRVRIQNQGWDDSIFVSINQNLKQFGVSVQSVAVLFQDFITKTLKIPNLAQLIADGAEDVLMARIQYAVGQMSSLGVSLIGDSEEFAKLQTPITGLVDLLKTFMDLTAAAAGLPKTRLFGQQLGTLAGADETTRDYYDGVKAYQEKTLRAPVTRIIALLLAEQRKGQAKDWSFEFSPLWQPTDKELADTRKTQAETDQIYITNSVLDPAEVAVSRFGPDGYSMETVIDTSTRTPAGDGGDEPDEKVQP